MFFEFGWLFVQLGLLLDDAVGALGVAAADELWAEPDHSDPLRAEVIVSRPFVGFVDVLVMRYVHVVAEFHEWEFDRQASIDSLHAVLGRR